MDFNELRSKALDAAAVAAQKTKELASITKARASICVEEEKIRRAQTELGKLYYRDYVLNEEMDDAEYLPWCDKITESRAVIDDLKSMIEAVKRGEVYQSVNYTVEDPEPNME